MSRLMPRLSGRIAVALALSSAASVVAGPAFAADAGLIDRGKYIATASDCVACHSAPGGEAMAGGLAIPT